MSSTATSDAGNVLSHDSYLAESESVSAVEEVPARYVHPEARTLFNVVQCARYVPIVGPAVEAFGPRCVTALGCVYVLSKGVADNVLKYSIYPMFTHRFGVSAEVYQRMSGISSMGFSIKPLTAIFSDTFAFFGYTKRWYMTLSCIVGCVCCVVYGVLPASSKSASAAAAMIFIATFCIANVDVLSEGHYSRLIKQHPGPGADLISWIWALIMVGSIIASAIQGPLSDRGTPQAGVFVSAGLLGACTIFFVFNWYGEKKNLLARSEDHAFLQQQMGDAAEKALAAKKSNKPDEINSLVKDAAHMVSPGESSHSLTGLGYVDDGTTVGFQVVKVAEVSDESENAEVDLLELPTCCCNAWEMNTEVIQRNTLVSFYGILMTIGVIIMTILTIVGTTYELLYGCIVISVVLCTIGFFCIPVIIMKANLFGWCQLASYILIPGALDSFYMASPECLPDGPHFSQAFYNTIGAVIGNCAGLVGVYLFAKVFSKRSYRLTFIITTIIQVVASIFDLIIVKRWNRPHMPDKAMYILGDAVVYQVCYMLNYMPMNMLISRLCPKGSESTMFAILASFSNMGASMSSTIGAVLMETVWPVVTNTVPCDFSNVQWLIITGHLVCPLVCIPLVFLLIPGARVCDELDAKSVEAVPILQNSLDRFKAWWNRKESNSATENVQLEFTEPIDSGL